MAQMRVDGHVPCGYIQIKSPSSDLRSRTLKLAYHYKHTLRLHSRTFGLIRLMLTSRLFCVHVWPS